MNAEREDVVACIVEAKRIVESSLQTNSIGYCPTIEERGWAEFGWEEDETSDGDDETGDRDDDEKKDDVGGDNDMPTQPMPKKQKRQVSSAPSTITLAKRLHDITNGAAARDDRTNRKLVRQWMTDAHALHGANFALCFSQDSQTFLCDKESEELEEAKQHWLGQQFIDGVDQLFPEARRYKCVPVAIKFEMTTSRYECQSRTTTVHRLGAPQKHVATVAFYSVGALDVWEDRKVINTESCKRFDWVVGKTYTKVSVGYALLMDIEKLGSFS